MAGGLTGSRANEPKLQLSSTSGQQGKAWKPPCLKVIESAFWRKPRTFAKTTPIADVINIPTIKTVDTDASGGKYFFEDYVAGERLNHPEGITIDNSDHTKKNKGSIDVGVNKGIEIKKDKEVKGIGKGKGSEKDKNIIKVECMTEDQIINEDKICIDNII